MVSAALYELSGASTWLDEALNLLEEVDVDRLPDDAARREHELWLASMLLERYDVSGRYDDLDHATAMFEVIVNTLVTPTSEADLPAVLGLAQALLRQHAVTGEDAYLQRARVVTEPMMARAASAPSGQAALCRMVRAECLVACAVAGLKSWNILVDLDEADRLIEAALADTTSASSAKTTAQLHLVRAQSLHRRYLRTSDVSHADAARSAAEDAASAPAVHAATHAAALCLLGDIESAASDEPCNEERLVLAADRYRAGCYTAGADVNTMWSCARSWRSVAAQLGRWESLREASTVAEELLRQQYRVQRRRADKERALIGTDAVYADLALAHARLGNVRAAVDALERGRARLSQERLHHEQREAAATKKASAGPGVQILVSAGSKLTALQDAELRGDDLLSPDARRRLSRPQLIIQAMQGVLDIEDPNAAFDDGPAADPPAVLTCYIAVGETEGLALLVAPTGETDHVPLMALSRTEVRDRAARFNCAYQDRRTDAAGWTRQLNAVTQWLWESVLGPLTDWLDHAQSVVLIPCGELGRLPLQAAWHEDAGTPTGRTYAVDRCIIGIAASAAVARRSVNLSRQVTSMGLLLVEQPYPVHEDWLPTAEEEARLVSACYPQATVRVLRLANASRRAVLDELTGQSSVHWIGHGVASAIRPLASHLIVADDEQVTLADVMTRRGMRTRLVFLSACAVGAIGSPLPDESIGFPNALLMAGAGGVIAASWAVPDLPTSLLVARFYELWRNDGLVPAAALRGAQQWVRDSDNGTKLDRFPGVYMSAASSAPPPVSTPSHFLWRAAKTHSDPYHWAGFTYTGVPLPADGDSLLRLLWYVAVDLPQSAAADEHDDLLTMRQQEVINAHPELLSPAADAVLEDLTSQLDALDDYGFESLLVNNLRRLLSRILHVGDATTLLEARRSLDAACSLARNPLSVQARADPWLRDFSEHHDATTLDRACSAYSKLLVAVGLKSPPAPGPVLMGMNDPDWDWQSVMTAAGSAFFFRYLLKQDYGDLVQAEHLFLTALSTRPDDWGDLLFTFPNWTDRDTCLEHWGTLLMHKWLRTRDVSHLRVSARVLRQLDAGAETDRYSQQLAMSYCYLAIVKSDESLLSSARDLLSVKPSSPETQAARLDLLVCVHLLQHSGGASDDCLTEVGALISRLSALVSGLDGERLASSREALRHHASHSRHRRSADLQLLVDELAHLHRCSSAHDYVTVNTLLLVADSLTVANDPQLDGGELAWMIEGIEGEVPGPSERAAPTLRGQAEELNRRRLLLGQLLMLRHSHAANMEDLLQAAALIQDASGTGATTTGPALAGLVQVAQSLLEAPALEGEAPEALKGALAQLADIGLGETPDLRLLALVTDLLSRGNGSEVAGSGANVTLSAGGARFPHAPFGRSRWQVTTMDAIGRDLLGGGWPVLPPARPAWVWV